MQKNDPEVGIFFPCDTYQSRCSKANIRVAMEASDCHDGDEQNDRPCQQLKWFASYCIDSAIGLTDRENFMTS